jgi:hypothetical protein
MFEDGDAKKIFGVGLDKKKHVQTLLKFHILHYIA